jgi:hypothetical protein
LLSKNAEQAQPFRHDSSKVRRIAMNYVLPLMMVGMLAGGAGYANLPQDEERVSVSLKAPQAEDGQLTYAARSPGVDAVCLIKRVAGKTPLISALELDADCSEVFEDLSKAVSWLDREDGSAAIVDKAGKELLVLGPSDGFAYETSEPGSPIVTLTALGNV